MTNLEKRVAKMEQAAKPMQRRSWHWLVATRRQPKSRRPSAGMNLRMTGARPL